MNVGFLHPGRTRLYLAGDEAAAVAALWGQSPLEVPVMDGAVGSASAVKTFFATWTKGTAALLDEWAVSIPHLAEQSELTAFGNGPKAWRFVGEMEEIAKAFAAHDLPDGFASASADVYRRMASMKDSPWPTLDLVLAAILG